jgi:glycosyltransferase involved in cell wall biosynthesis
MHNHSCAIVIPVYNHASRVEAVIDQCRSLAQPVIVVNDGSTDDTGQRLGRRRDILLINHPANLGKGAAFISGMGLAHRMGCTAALTIDADGQHDPADLRKLLAKAGQQRSSCLVVGCRMAMEAGQNVPWTSRFGRGFSNFWVWMSGGPLLTDTQSGLRLYPLPDTLHLRVAARRYQYEVEVLVRAHRAGIPIVETPVRVIYQPGSERISHFHPWQDFWRNAATFSRLIFTRIMGRLRP